MNIIVHRKYRYLAVIIITAMYLITGPTSIGGKCLVLSLCGISFYQVIMNYRRNRMGFMLMFFFMLSYSLASINYYFFSEHISIRTEVENVDTIYYVNLYCLIFYITISYFIKSSGPSFKINSNIPFIGKYKSNLIWIICILIALLCMIKGKSGQNILASGGYSNTMSTLEVSSLFGYGILFILISLFFSHTKFKLRFVFLIAGLYVLRDLSFGGRVDSLMLCLAMFMMYFRFVMKKKNILIMAIIAFIFASLWEVYRNIINGSIADVMANNGNINISIITGNSIDVFYASMRIIYFIQNGILDIWDRFESGFYFIIATIIPFEYLPPVANLSSYLQSSYSSGGGGLAPIFMYAMYGLLGVVVFGALIGISLNRLKKHHYSIYGYFYSILIIATAPRWYAYYPITATKYCVYGLFFLIVMRQFDRLLKSGVKNKLNL